MPLRAPRPCLRPGCKRLVPNGYCEEHEPKDVRGSYASRVYRTAAKGAQGGFDRGAWDRARRDFLRRNPCCAEHLRMEPPRRERATVVDHVVPHKGDAELFWNESNWQPLCYACHNRKTATEDGGFGR